MDRLILAALDSDDVETHGVRRESMVSCDVHGGSTNDFSLLVVIDCMTRRRERSRSAIPYFDKRQAVPIQHDQVDFTAAAVEVSRNGTEILSDQIIERQLFSLTTYSSCIARSHGASSAASGAISVPSSLMS